MQIHICTKAMDLSCKRIQFTPDMMPADVIGTKVYNMQKREFELRKSSVFGNLILADEINRTPPKTQAGLLEAMEEEAVSIDGETMKLLKILELTIHQIYHVVYSSATYNT